uniref:RagB/SusD family nutrient uptake outer membrane protein n=1 Tax=Dyadobacter sp. MSC1_007 TaxID=2909264 RepID=UPI00202DF8F3|nr:RagB/SusD family nutrient uptake outer membrane protein [Dyadobacter sp. MSC1_007]
MRITIKNILVTSFCLTAMTLPQACEPNLDYANTSAINPDNVWNDEKLISAFLSDIHGNMLPGWPVNGDATDEGMNAPGSMSSYLRGIISVASTGQNLSYTNIDKINFLLDRLPTVSSTVVSEEKKKQMAGQALFWRAWDYFGKVSTFGGVPLILKPQDPLNREALFVPRNKTSECITQIIADLDLAIASLPDQWDNANYGRIDKGAAMAFKGKVLLWYASPLFNPTGDVARWQKAYDANKAAVDFLKSQGKGLLSTYGQIWKQERNKEVIMVNQFSYPDHPFNQAGIRPQPLTKDAANNNQPVLSLLNAYPKKDGSPMQFDVAKLASDPAYNEQYLTDFVTNRDDRFYATIFTGGTPYPTPDLPAGTKYWSAWRKIADAASPGGVKYLSLAADQMGVTIGAGVSGFFAIKGLDNTLIKTLIGNAATDWVEIRFAEVLMNYGEAANEVGKSEEALQVLKDIRARAGIIPGTSGKYGITAATQAEMREAYMAERFVEFAFENKRWGDLRRWKRFDVINKLGFRHGIYFVLKDGQKIDWTDDLSDPAVRKKFTAVYIDNLDGDPQFKFNLDLNHWFYPISQPNLDASAPLKQNAEWGGPFNPLD